MDNSEDEMSDDDEEESASLDQQSSSSAPPADDPESAKPPLPDDKKWQECHICVDYTMNNKCHMRRHMIQKHENDFVQVKPGHWIIHRLLDCDACEPLTWRRLKCNFETRYQIDQTFVDLVMAGMEPVDPVMQVAKNEPVTGEDPDMSEEETDGNAVSDDSGNVTAADGE
jgi:hypothetical protein